MVTRIARISNICFNYFYLQTKPGSASGTSVIYGKEAPELQIRKLGDLFFMLKLYKQAYNCYHTAKKDFQVCIFSMKPGPIFLTSSSSRHF